MPTSGGGNGPYSIPRNESAPRAKLRLTTIDGAAVHDLDDRQLLVTVVNQLSALTKAVQTIDGNVVDMLAQQIVHDASIEGIRGDVRGLTERLDSKEIEHRAREVSSHDIEVATEEIRAAAEKLEDAAEEVKTSPGFARLPTNSDRVRQVATAVVNERELQKYRKRAEWGAGIWAAIIAGVVSALIVALVMAYSSGRSVERDSWQRGEHSVNQERNR